MSNKDWTSKLRDQMTDYQEPVKHDLWAGIAQSLAQNQPAEGVKGIAVGNPINKIEKDSKRIEKDSKAHVITLKRWSAAAAAVALLGIGGSYVYLHQEDVEQGNASLSSHASTPAQSNISAKTGALKNAPLLAADFKSADPEKTGGLHASVSAQSAALMNDEGETMKAVASEEAPLLAAEYKSAESVQSQAESAQNQAESAQNQAESRMGYAEPRKGYVELEKSYAEQTTSSSYSFSKNNDVAGVSMKLYAENLGAGMGNVNSGSNIANRFSDSGVMADPMPGVYPDPSVGGSNDVDYLMAAAYKALQKSPQGKAKHHAPVSVGMQLAFGIAPRLSMSTGVVYTRTSSDFYPYAPNNDYNVHQVLHYVGIPVGLNYELWSSGGFHAYVMAGAEAAYNVKNDTDEDGTRKQDAKRDRVQFSGKASLGAQYDISQSVGLYIEPGAKYYFDNGSDIENTFKDKKLNFNLQFGLRFNL